MASRALSSTHAENLAELVEQLGDIPLDRILMRPAPGTATEKDVLAALNGPRKRLCELVDGVLVEKPVGTPEAILAGLVIHLLWDFLEENDLGVVAGADGPYRLFPGLVRIPDVSFIPWSRIPGEEVPKDAVSRLVPELVVEVISRGNTKKEIQRKLREYFKVGVRLVWVLQPRTQTAEVYTSPAGPEKLKASDALDGGQVLPGFRLPLPRLFGRMKRGRPNQRS